MKVFISWSGRKSQGAAIALRDWLPGVINSVEPFVSSEDIYAGARWQSEIASELDVTNFGIVCVTRENQGRAWLNFEAGALAKAVDLSRLIPLAIDLQPSDIEPPLGQFQARPADEEGLKAVVFSINNALTENRLSDQLLRTSFDVWWPRLQTELDTIAHETSGAEPPLRSERKLLEETLDTVRSLSRNIDLLAPRQTGADWLRRETFARALDALPERERQILILRFGLQDERPKTLEEIGRILDISRERVRQIEGNALQRLVTLKRVSESSEPSELPLSDAAEQSPDE